MILLRYISSLISCLGMAAVTFKSQREPSNRRGYPQELAIAIVVIAITTCIASNLLLAHVATISRNKLAEIVMTRKELWKTIAEKENAEQAAAAKSDFIASASHEIRTPLHHLQGYSDLLSQTRLTEEGRMHLSAIQHATKTLALSKSITLPAQSFGIDLFAVTNNVLDWSKLERRADTGCRPISLDMRDVCESVLTLLPNIDDAEDVDVMVVVSPNVPHSLFLDETYIHRILMNLLSNALKFTRSGYILVLVQTDDGKLTIKVHDTGPGIPPEFLPRLFDPFTQAQTRGTQRGTGLGLSIIKQLLHKMRGTIEVDSNYNHSPELRHRDTGSKFTVTIPVLESRSSSPLSGQDIEHREIAIFSDGDESSATGARLAWECFGCNVTIVEKYSDLVDADWNYIWMNASVLVADPVLRRKLTAQARWPIVVNYSTEDQLNQLPEVRKASNCLVLQKPLMWHKFEQSFEASTNDKSSPIKAVSFADEVEVLEENDEKNVDAKSPVEQPLVLLVEDNPVSSPSPMLLAIL